MYQGKGKKKLFEDRKDPTAKTFMKGKQENKKKRNVQTYRKL